MSQPILRTKVISPRRRSDHFQRPRLLQLLQQQLERSLLLVIAPAGYGKTTLLLDLVHHMDRPVCWYSADVQDRNLYRFLSYFLAAISHTFPAFGRESQAALQSFVAGEWGYEQFMSILLNELYEQVPEPFVLVIDDYHAVSEQEEIDTFVSQFIQQMDQQCHLFLTSRRLLALPDLPLMLARGQVGGVGIEELAFRHQEIQGLLQQNFAMEISDAEATDLVQSTEGWVTGLMLSTQLMRPGMSQQSSLVRAAGVSLYDYLAQQVLAQQTPETIDFLLRTAPLGEFNLPLVEQLLEPLFPDMQGSWQTLLNDIIEQNLFIFHLDGGHRTEDEWSEDERAEQARSGEGWIRYHALFRQFLQKALATERCAEEEMILQRMAGYFTEKGEWAKAFQALQKLGDPLPIAQFIERAWDAVVQRDEFRLLEDWLDFVPNAMIEERPLLIILRGCLDTLTGDWEEGLRAYTRAIDLLGSAPDIAPDSLALADALMRRSTAHRFFGNYTHAIEDARAALKTLEHSSDSLRFNPPADPAVPPPAIQDTVDPKTENPNAAHGALVQGKSCKALGLSLYMSGQAEEGMQWLEKALSTFEKNSAAQSAAVVAVDIALMHMNAGHYIKAERQFRRGLKQWQALHHVSPQARVLNNLGVVYHLQGKFAEAQQALEESWSLAQKGQLQNIMAFVLVSLGDLAVDQDQVAQARKHYTRAYQITRELDHHFLMLYTELAEAHLDCLATDWAGAYSHLDRAGRLVVAEVSEYEWGLYRLAMGRFYLAQHQNERALTPLEDAVNCFRAGKMRIELPQTYLLLALAQHRLQNVEQTGWNLQRLLDHVGSLESWQPIVSLARHFSQDLSELLAALLEQTHSEGLLLEVSLLRSLLQRITDMYNTVAPATTAHSDELGAIQEQIGSTVDQGTRAANLATNPVDPPPPLFVPSSQSSPSLPIHSQQPVIESALLMIRALGHVDITFHGKSLRSSDWQAQSARDLFLCLIAHPDGLTKEEIGELFWPDSSPGQLKSRFKNAIYRLRKAVDPEVVLFQRSRYQFNHDFEHSYDVQIFVESVQQARRSAEVDAQKAWYQRAIAAYGGDYLPDVDAPWIWAERERLNRLFVESYLELGALHLASGEFVPARRCAEEILTHDPCLEEAHRLLMQIHADMGNRAEIARQFQECQRALNEEIDAPPSPQTVDLYQRLMG